MSSLDQQTIKDIVSLIDLRINGSIDARYQFWITGRRVTATTYALREAGIANRIYVRPSNDSFEYKLIWGNASGVNIPVRIEREADGEWRLAGVDYASSSNIGEKVDTLLQPAVAGDTSRIVIPGYNLRIGRPRIDAAGGLNAYIEPFHYWYEGVYKFWEGGSVDLTSAVPGSADLWRWVKLGINPATNAITTSNGSTQNLYEPLTDALLAAIAMNTTIVCGGVKLRYGQTKLGIVEGDFVAAHPHFFTPHPLLQKSNLGATTNPTTGDDSADGYAIGSVWINTTADSVYICTDASVGAAAWQTITVTVDTFLELTDTPSSYSGAGGQYVKVNSGASALEFASLPSIPTSIGSMFEPLAPPSSPDALDDEFDNSSVAVTWTEIDHATKLTATEDSAGLLLTATSSSGNCGLVKSIPAGDFTIETFVNVNLVGTSASDQSFAGLSLWQGTGSTDDLINLIVDPQNTRVALVTWSAYNTFGGITASVTTIENGFWLRVSRSSTTYNFYYATNGITWRRLHTGTLAFTPSHFGPSAFAASAATAYGRFAFFRYTPSELNSGASIGGRRVNLYA